MKIGLIVPGFSADERDWCIPALLNLARSLAASHEVHVFALRYPHRRALYRLGDLTVHSFDGREQHGAASLQLWATALNALVQEHGAARLNVVHAVYGGEAGWLAVLAARILRVPSIVSFVGGELVGLADIRYGADLYPRQRLMNRLTLRFADAILGASEQLTLEARARGARAQTVPLGVDTQMFSPTPHLERGESVRILNVGSLIPVKDHATLLRAFGEFLCDVPHARLSLVGTGALEDELRALAHSLELGNRVEFVGALAHDRLPEWYRGADLYVQSSRHEGEGMAVLEAAACGTALVGTSVGVLAELANRRAALAAPPHDPVALARAMRQALDVRDMLAVRARQVVVNEYSLERVHERLVARYASLQAKGIIHVLDSLPRA